MVAVFCGPLMPSDNAFEGHNVSLLQVKKDSLSNSGLIVIWIHPGTVMTVEEGSILDCKDSGAINTYRSNADEPQAPCTFSAMARLGDQTSGRPVPFW